MRLATTTAVVLTLTQLLGCAGSARKRRFLFPKPAEQLRLLAGPPPWFKIDTGHRAPTMEWTLEGPLPVLLGRVPHSLDEPWRSWIAQAGFVATEDMRCYAREMGRFRVQHEHWPARPLETFIAGACGIQVETGVAMDSADTVVDDGDEAATIARLQAAARRRFDRLPANPLYQRLVGIWISRQPGQATIVMGIGYSGIELAPISATASGTELELRGTVLGKPASKPRILGRRMDGPRGGCTQDPQVALPQFRLLCALSPGESNRFGVMVPLDAEPHAKILMLQLRAGTGDELSYRIESVSPAPEDAGATDPALVLGQLVNRAREARGLPPLEPLFEPNLQRMLPWILAKIPSPGQPRWWPRAADAGELRWPGREDFRPVDAAVIKEAVPGSANAAQVATLLAMQALSGREISLFGPTGGRLGLAVIRQGDAVAALLVLFEPLPAKQASVVLARALGNMNAQRARLGLTPMKVLSAGQFLLELARKLKRGALSVDEARLQLLRGARYSGVKDATGFWIMGGEDLAANGASPLLKPGDLGIAALVVPLEKQGRWSGGYVLIGVVGTPP